MKFKKIYIEISNSCNFSCSFCFQSDRKKRFMTTDEFRFVVSQIRPFSDYVYLHVLGEPLLHPQFREILKIASEADLKVNISTNGSLLNRHFDYLFENPVRQINISLHDAEENISKGKWKEFILSTLKFSKELSEKTFINLRLWNQTNELSRDFNQLCFEIIRSNFSLSEDFDKINPNERNITLSPNIYLQSAPRFQWTDTEMSAIKTCYGLRDQIAVLSDGNVVPCCIDADANLLLGNIFKEDLADILQTDKSLQIRKGFEQHKAVEEWCQKCGFRV